MISREEAVEILHEKYYENEFYFAEHDDYPEGIDGNFQNALLMAINEFSQPERPKGRWEFDRHPITHNWLYRCTSCDGWNEDTPPFCPNCGADMRGEEE